MDLSLEEIIKKKKIKNSIRGSSNARGRGTRNRKQSRADNSGFNKGFNQSNKSKIQGKNQITDARQKIILKNKKLKFDARNKLLNKKPADVRLKLMKLKENNLKVAVKTQTGRNTILKNRILQSSIPNTDRPNNRGSFNKDRLGRGRYRGVQDSRIRQDMAGIDIKRSITNHLVTRGTRTRGRGITLKRSFNNNGFDDTIILETDEVSGFRSDNINSFRRGRIFGRVGRGYNSDLDTEFSSMTRTINQGGRPGMNNYQMKMTPPSEIKVVMQNHSASIMAQKNHDMMDVEEYNPYYQPVPPQALHSTLHQQGDEMFVRGRHGGKMSQELLARLDTPATVPRSMGIFSAQSNQLASIHADVGHRIVVSNLQPSVTHEDIKELFEDIGPLLASRIVRPGTAEVIYNLLKDAKKAVEAYHNRQLDGQPMKCLLVNPRALMNTGLSGAPRAVPAKIPNSSKSNVTPDLITIHKALFNK
uniref:RRM domain-containing protein n=2 Tax=Clastoptera arizonana TaxID=38151 RepID=A0A1B6DIL4_9HEMI